MSNQLSVRNRRELTECERAKIITLSEDGQSVRKISKKLGYPKSTVQDTISVTRLKEAPIVIVHHNEAALPCLMKMQKII